jgi:uncharacterized membrane protein YdbT with pleckstrin-like domain
MKVFKKSITAAVALLFIAIIFIPGCVPEERQDDRHFTYQARELAKTVNEKLKDGTLKDSLPPELTDALSEIIKSGNIRRFLPPTGVIISALLIPIFAVIGLFAFLVIFARLYHMRAMAMIEKGVYERRPKRNIRWELFFLFAGLILVFLGPAISIYMISLYGFQSWTFTAGIIPLFIGFAVLVFYKQYLKIKNSNPA